MRLIASSVKLLDLGLHPLLFVLADDAVLLGLLQVVLGVAAHVADGDLLLLGVLAGELGQVLAALLGQRRDRDAQGLAVDDRVEAEAGVADRLLDRDRPAPCPRR